MKAVALDNRQLLTRMTMNFALLVAVNSLLSLFGPAGIALSLGISVLLQVIYISMVAVLVNRPGGASGSGELWAAVKPVLSPAVWTAVVFLAGVIAGSFLLIIPGLIIATLWFVVIQVAVVERLPVFASLRRSRELVQGNFWRVLAVLLTVAAFSLLAALFATLIASPFGPGAISGLVASFLVALVVYPFNAIAPACVYQALAESDTPTEAEPEA